jgi:hypothetical protein
MKLVCRVYWEMCQDVEVELPDEGMTLNPSNMIRASELAQEQVDSNMIRASELAQEQVDIKAPGAEFVPNSINCDWLTDVQMIEPAIHTQPGHDETDCPCQSCEELRK